MTMWKLWLFRIIAGLMVLVGLADLIGMTFGPVDEVIQIAAGAIILAILK